MFNKLPARDAAAAARPAQADDTVAERAIGFARKNATPLTPEVYAVWYAYAGRENRDLNERLDTAMNTSEELTPAFLADLYHEHVAPPLPPVSLDTLSNDFQAMLGGVSGALDENMKEHSLFSGTLRTAKANLVQGTSKREVSEVIRVLHLANHQHLAAVQKLSLQLEKSRGQVSRLKSELMELKRTTNTDYLTGLANRRASDEILDNAIFAARQKKHSLGILIATIDGLQHLGDTLGIQAGDLVIRLFAEQLSRELRSGFTAARFSGARFLVVMPDCNLRDGFALAEQVRKRFKSMEWAAPSVEVDALSVSCGGTALRAGDTRDSMLERADSHRIRAQTAGVDRTVIE